MKYYIVALSLVACAYAVSPANSDVEAVVNNYQNEAQPDGQFVYGFDTSNGISAQSSGHVETVGKDEVALKVSGSNKYVGPDGQTYEVTYTADENGFQAQVSEKNLRGAHLPTPPPAEPIPDYIQKSLKYIAEHPYVEKKQ